MDAAQPLELVRPWRRAAILAGAVALLELAAIVVLGLALLAGPLARSVRHHAASQAAAATAPPAKARPAPAHVKPPPAVPRLSRARIHVLVLNANGAQGAAGSTAMRLRAAGYRSIATGNAAHGRDAASIVMYRPGYRPEARRLARDLGVRLVGPLDGLRIAELKGSQVVEILGN